MNEFIIPNSNSVSNDFNYSRTDLDAQEQQIAEFIKKGGKVINLDNSEQPKKKSAKKRDFNNQRINSKMHLVLCYLKRSGKRMTGTQIQEKFGISAQTLGVQMSLINEQASKQYNQNSNPSRK
ncbi:hypothetical protein JHQ51_01180 [Moraxella catarrhalis]|uniref:hypothetical protein n=1 Tax=Moraxella catarrhalis TaxID=480 RepID=UPI00003E0D8C|nr:hypothetical protein [Moraxella catarrhalis]EGE15088.1 hypothetical protein E9O_05534 [Moraxella catarrhalis 12P80B1]MCG6819161.1 hypothetical protein [Moraxella catarrhalis]MCG6831261.1 hypothetical protein [Moraxella catarrhalis]MPW57605.1 hypothetical protein [Moraxella catarrhalis]MPW60272.1 hypothetical protein [Moraxella catarrhalis]